MDMFTIAIKMETEGEAFYRDLASRSTTDGFRNIFTLLADDELSHVNIFKGLQSRMHTASVGTHNADMAAEIFRNLQKGDFLQEQEQLTIYERALEIELTSIEYYSSQIDQSDTDEQRKVLELIINEERKHFDLLDDIIVMVERPEAWVESAEFGTREEY